jgi:hypothetical protein
MRGKAAGNEKYQQLRCGNLVTGSVMLLLRRTFAGGALYLFSSYSVVISQKETHSHSVS